MNKLNISIVLIGLVLCFFFVKGNSETQEGMHGNDATSYLTEETQSDKRIYRPVIEEEVTHFEPDIYSNHLFLKELSMVVIKLDSLQNEQIKILDAKIDSLEAKLKRAHITYREVEGDPSNYRVLVEISFEPVDSLEGK